jgi:hypothetical protein
MYRRMRRVASPERSLPAVLGGAAALAVGVSLAETPCTAGLPLLWTDMLADRHVAAAGAVLLFAVYLLVFLLDELVVFALAIVTMRATKAQEHHGRFLQLVSGALMVVLAVTMLVAPHLLETVGGTALVFGLAAIAVASVVAVERVVTPRRPRTAASAPTSHRASPRVAPHTKATRPSSHARTRSMPARARRHHLGH